MSEQAIPVKPGDVVYVRHLDGTERLVTILSRGSAGTWVCDDGWTRPATDIVRHADSHVAALKRVGDVLEDQWIADANAAIDADVKRRKAAPEG